MKTILTPYTVTVTPTKVLKSINADVKLTVKKYG